MKKQTFLQTAFISLTVLFFSSASLAESYDTEISFGLGKIDTDYSDISTLNIGFTKKLEEVEQGEAPFELNNFFNPVSEVSGGINQFNVKGGTTINFLNIGGHYFNPSNKIIVDFGLNSIHSDFTDENTGIVSVGKYFADNAKIEVGLESGSSEDDDNEEFDIAGSHLFFQYVGKLNNQNSFSGTAKFAHREQTQKSIYYTSKVGKSEVTLYYYVTHKTGFGVMSSRRKYPDGKTKTNGIRFSHFTDPKTWLYGSISKFKDGDDTQDTVSLGVTIRQ